MVQVPTNYKMGTGLAATIMGQQAGLEAEQQGLANLTTALRQPQDMVKSQEAMAQMNDPRYIQMKLQNDMSKFGKETSINEIESSYNKANRAVAHLKAAQAMGPQALQQASMQYLQEMQIDPASEKGQILLQDPVGSAEKMVQFYATAATNNPDYLQKYSLGEQSAQKAMDVAKLQGENAMRVAQLHEGGQNARADRALSTDKLLGEMISRANQGDEVAQQWVNTYTQIQRAKNPSFGGMALNPQGGMTTKGEANPLPFSPKVQPSGKGGVIKLD